MASIATLVAACGSAGGGAGTQGTTTVTGSTYHAHAGKQGGSLVYSDWEEVSDLNPLANTANTAAQGEVALWQFLWTNGSDNKPVPQLVSEIPTQQNGSVKVLDGQHMDVTINLLPGLKWSDGQPLTTQDVKFTWDAICDPATGAESTNGWDHIQSMTIDSPTKMVWHFGPTKAGFCGLSTDLTSGLYAPYLSLAMPVLPEHVLQGTPHAQWISDPYFTQGPTVVSGAYKVKSFVPGPTAQLVMVPNPDFYAGRQGTKYFAHKPYLNQLIYKIYGDKASEINGLKTGDADIGLDLIANDLPALKSITNDKVRIANPIQYELVSFNVANNTIGCGAQKWAQSCGKPTVFKNDQVLRQALSLATDKATMNRQLVGGLGKVMNSPFPANFTPWYDTSLPAFHYDPSKAKKMLDQDGWKMGSGGVRVKDGRPLQFTISTTSGNPQRTAEEELLGHDWGLVGAKLSIVNYPADQLFPGFGENGILATGQFDVGLYAEVQAPDPDSWGPAALISQIPSAANPGAGNEGHWMDQKLNDLFLQGQTTINPAQRQKIYNQAQQEWETYQGEIELYQRPELTVTAPYVGNFDPGSPQPAYDTWNTADWYRTSG
ncbi:MAG: peptide ABC transporter substrate-binding protein [Candidatus Dormibacteraceae bacterium]